MYLGWGVFWLAKLISLAPAAAFLPTAAQLESSVVLDGAGLLGLATGEALKVFVILVSPAGGIIEAVGTAGPML